MQKIISFSVVSDVSYLEKLKKINNKSQGKTCIFNNLDANFRKNYYNIPHHSSVWQWPVISFSN